MQGDNKGKENLKNRTELTLKAKQSSVRPWTLKGLSVISQIHAANCTKGSIALLMAINTKMYTEALRENSTNIS